MAAEKWSQYTTATFPLTGAEIFALGITAVASHKLTFTQLCQQILNQHLTTTISIQDGGGSAISLNGTGGMNLTSGGGFNITTGQSFNTQSGSSVNFTDADGGSFQLDGFGNFLVNCGSASIVSFSEGVLLQDGDNTQVNLDGNGNIILQLSGVLEINGQNGFTGTLAAAITAGANVTNGIITT